MSRSALAVADRFAYQSYQAYHGRLRSCHVGASRRAWPSAREEPPKCGLESRDGNQRLRRLVCVT
jgi:hypothetical protein